ncbi:hypothetical protein [Dyadobacter sp. CY323]|uniref:hypothetical protein n=1 Tax=Dyadobacter sp. CY323 TaxID=2907302 RepID=UPI001F2482F3|nr:hypothetical protein [Dyadobacter sp. CY323]MCE6989067.1 hypothetical protein [Dyadobacter sp. CY323]
MNVAIIIILSVILQLAAPWWVIAIIPFAVLLWRPTNSAKAFWSGFLGIGMSWLLYGYYFHFISDGAISDRVAGIFFLPNGILLLLLAALAGGLVGGFSGLSGFFIRRLFKDGSSGISSRSRNVPIGNA